MAFVPGPTASRASGGIGVFCPGWSHQPGQKRDFLSRLVAPPGTKGPFCPGWCYQPGQKVPPRDNSKGSYSILSHMYYLSELARKSYARQEVLGSNPARCKKNLASGTFCPGSATRDKSLPGGRTGTKCPAAKIFFAPHGIRSQDLLPSV